MKVLLAEDFEDIRAFLSMLLEEFGYEIITARDGRQAWEILQQKQDIDLVLSDWMMPHIDGLQLCQMIRRSSWSRYIYIILMTAKVDKNALVVGMEAGADDFLIKPVNINELRVRLVAGKRILTLEKTLAERNQTLQATNEALLASNDKLKITYEQISQDLKSAAKMQKALLPKATTIKGIRFDWLFYPSHFVAGDMFNFFELDENYLGFYQLDVSGHGVRSALLSFTLYHRIANTPHHAGLLMHKIKNIYKPIPPHRVLYQLNNLFQSTIYSKLYFTIIYGYIHKHTGELQLAQAGHPHPIYWARNTSKAHPCGTGGFPVGLLPNMTYETTTLHLAQGDRLFIYSDGITDCTNTDNVFFSQERLLTLLEKMPDSSIAEILQQVGNSLREWRGKQDFDDDTTVLAIERL